MPSPEAHYKATCRSLVEEAMTIQGLGEMANVREEKGRKTQIVSYRTIITLRECAMLKSELHFLVDAFCSLHSSVIEFSNCRYPLRYCVMTV